MKAWILTNRFNLLAFVLIMVLVVCGIMPAHSETLGYGLMALSTTAFPVNPELSAIAISYSNPLEALIADQVLPRIDTAKKFTYTEYNQADGFTVPETRVGRKSEPNMVDFGGTQLTKECIDFGLDDLIPNDEIDAWNSMPKAPGAVSPQAKSTMMLTRLVGLDREIRVANLVFNAANYVTDNKDDLSTGANRQFDKADSDALAILTDALDVPLVRPNYLVLGQEVWTKLRRNKTIVQAIGNSAQTTGYASRQQVAELLELPGGILVGAGRVNTAKKGKAPNYVRAWGKYAALLYIDPMAAQMDQPNFGFTAQWGSRIAGDIPEPKAGLRGGVRVRSGESVLEVICSQDSGYLFTKVIS
ncbi:MAG: phage capsid protein [Gallionella sp.]|nr:phage capsid protein [Gallionella sp.]MDD4947201.1 phage capsid protein [Gallionella sp.]MDD5611875.1 phage capsid protein [Gallionella sp.]